MKRWSLAAALLLAGCLFRPDAELRWFQPDSQAVAGAATEEEAHPAGAAALRLRRVQAAPFLRDRIVWRSDVEYGVYEHRRWTQMPASYVEQALRHELFNHRGLRRGEITAPALDVDVRAFDEVLAPAHEARVELAVRLVTAEQEPLLERVFTARRPIGDEEAGSVARAMGAALDAVVADLGGAVATALPHPAARPPARRR